MKRTKNEEAKKKKRMLPIHGVEPRTSLSALGIKIMLLGALTVELDGPLALGRVRLLRKIKALTVDLMARRKRFRFCNLRLQFRAGAT
jgi:hypothetical protein